MFICHMDKARTAKVISGDRKYIVAMKLNENSLTKLNNSFTQSNVKISELCQK